MPRKVCLLASWLGAAGGYRTLALELDALTRVLAPPLPGWVALDDIKLVHFPQPKHEHVHATYT